MNLLDLDFDELALTLDLSPSYRVKQLYSGLQAGLKIQEISALPLALRQELGEKYTVGVEIIEKLVSVDGSMKLLYRLDDGNIIEGVFMPHDYGSTLCVSTQVGCRMGCAFCASGIGGLVRNLTSGEMLGQVLSVNRLKGGPLERNITNLVLMGSGEPLDNYDNVVKFLRLVSSEDGINISRRNISLSTCGLTDRIRQLADDGLGVTLSISLHATTDEIRRQLMPIANKYSISEVVDAAKYYFNKTGRRIIYEYSMIKGKNIDYFDVKRLKEITKGYPSHINLIMLNPVKEKHLEGCTKSEAERFLGRLHAEKISATIRKSFGSDIMGACGQLRRSYLDSKKE